jgi:hypothetical protein
LVIIASVGTDTKTVPPLIRAGVRLEQSGFARKPTKVFPQNKRMVLRILKCGAATSTAPADVRSFADYVLTGRRHAADGSDNLQVC